MEEPAERAIQMAFVQKENPLIPTPEEITLSNNKNIHGYKKGRKED